MCITSFCWPILSSVIYGFHKDKVKARTFSSWNFGALSLPNPIRWFHQKYVSLHMSWSSFAPNAI
ncbi:hypothetical protein SERLA73DRAFT_127360 [Serpula lacrymans var. lacrymans S7.3]|uniref:Uncharacterized protein n=1 Tax=Serpula lacrymans var. lacrymans (strain S7.3) TaxID=936435 RepID=F8QGH1_SERL3|nr:hypothetical protein SERLA73DRAFT_127360 [Serpula lacrymans var. lacrymans S7.3]